MMEIIPYDTSSTVYLGHCTSCKAKEATESTCDLYKIDTEGQVLRDEPALVDQTVVYAFKNLVRKYKKLMGDSKDISIMTGGLQQYLNKKALRKCDTYEDHPQQDSLFHKLPVSSLRHLLNITM